MRLCVAETYILFLLVKNEYTFIKGESAHSEMIESRDTTMHSVATFPQIRMVRKEIIMSTIIFLCGIGVVSIGLLYIKRVC